MYLGGVFKKYQDWLFFQFFKKHIKQLFQNNDFFNVLSQAKSSGSTGISINVKRNIKVSFLLYKKVQHCNLKKIYSTSYFNFKYSNLIKLPAGAKHWSVFSITNNSLSLPPSPQFQLFPS